MTLQESDRSAPRPPIVCLCGSTRYMEAFFAAGWQATLAGHIVLSVGVCKHARDHGAEALGPAVAERLDELHKRKIDLADWVCILNVYGYVGPSTRSEIEYAIEHDKPIRVLWPFRTCTEPPTAERDLYDDTQNRMAFLIERYEVALRHKRRLPTHKEIVT